jgi:D-alanine-D-alanine ligase
VDLLAERPGSGRSGNPSVRPVVHVFIPYEISDGCVESPCYDTPAYRTELECWFERLNMEWHWTAITLDTLTDAIATVQQRNRTRPCLVFNLCDGDEVGGYPGVSVVKALEASKLPFTGARSDYYAITTCKSLMKDRLLEAGIATPAFVRLRTIPDDLDRLSSEVGFPALIKPESSSASVGISLKSVVHDVPSALAHIERLSRHSDWGSWVHVLGVFAERFVDGPEFTVFVVADREAPGGVRALPAAERIFHSALPPLERFLSYDRYWSEYTEEAALPGSEPFCRYALAEPALQRELAETALKAFSAVSGTGYGRVDIRMDARSRKLFVLEVNSNCGLSGDAETSVGQILQLTGFSIYELVALIVRDALERVSAAE